MPGRDIFLRLDLETGYGHHKKVITSGVDSKFGMSLGHLAAVRRALSRRVAGSSACTPTPAAGSSTRRSGASSWIASSKFCRSFPMCRCSISVVVSACRTAAASPASTWRAWTNCWPRPRPGHDVEIWLEPGRYLAAECGVLLARVTQLKSKGQYHYLGISTGMNSLIRPALYGAYHDIVNLSRLQASRPTGTTGWWARSASRATCWARAASCRPARRATSS